MFATTIRIIGPARARLSSVRLTTWLLALSVVLITGACQKAPPSDAAGVTPEDRRSPATPAATASNATGLAASSDPADTPALLSALTQQVRKYGMEQQRAPVSLADLVARGYLAQIPPAPSGKRFIINKKLEVELVNR